MECVALSQGKQVLSCCAWDKPCGEFYLRGYLDSCASAGRKLVEEELLRTFFAFTFSFQPSV